MTTCSHFVSCPNRPATLGVQRVFTYRLLYEPITVAVLTKAKNIFARSNTGIVGSNPTRGIDVCMQFFRVHVVLRM
jgi:hypothetical protein